MCERKCPGEYRHFYSKVSDRSYRLSAVSVFSLGFGRERNLCAGISGISSGSIDVFRPMMSRPEISVDFSGASSSTALETFSSSAASGSEFFASFLRRCFSFFLCLDFFFFFFSFSVADDALLSLPSSFSLSSPVEIFRFFCLAASNQNRNVATVPSTMKIWDITCCEHELAAMGDDNLFHWSTALRVNGYTFDRIDD